jgi:hypothetical protein
MTMMMCMTTVKINLLQDIQLETYRPQTACEALYWPAAGQNKLKSHDSSFCFGCMKCLVFLHEGIINLFQGCFTL